MEQAYQHINYIKSLSQLGKPVRLTQSGGWLLERPIPHSKEQDICGPYPFLVCNNWTDLAEDLYPFEDKYISLACVPDPFGNYDLSFLKSQFTDICRPFKVHYAIDLNIYSDTQIARNHRRNARKALKELTVHSVNEPETRLQEWNIFYTNLIEKHKINGIAAFSEDSFRQQLTVPGTYLFEARDHSGPVGMALFYTQDSNAYYHLAAYSDQGYAKLASFAIFSTAIDFFRSNNYHQIRLGGAAGLKPGQEDGLQRFKQGWANMEKNVYFCGKILNKERYRKLTASLGFEENSFFPAYRREL